MPDALPPASDRLDTRLRRGTLGNGPIRVIAHWLARLHARAEPGRGPDAAEGARRLGVRAARLAERLPEADRAVLRQVEAAQRNFLARHADRLRERERAGRVRALPAAPPRLAELHVAEALRVEEGEGAETREGDRVTWRPEGRDGPAAPRDGCADAAGLALELACGGRGDLAERLLSAYARSAHDFDLYDVADFHERDGALALAEAALERADPGALQAAHRLVWAALATRRRPLLPPVVVAVGGRVAHGKSTVSRVLAERLGAPRVEADRVRDALLERTPAAEGAATAADAEPSVHEEDWERAFAPDFADAVYGELLRCASVVLGSGRAVVLDACFPGAAWRRRARDLAHRVGHPFLFVECRAEAATVEARLAARGGAGWRELAGRLAERWEPVKELAPGEHAVLRTDAGLDLDPLLARLPAWPEGLPG